MSTTVIAFGRLIDIVGKGQITIPHATDTNQVLAQLQQQFPALASAAFIIAVDKQIVHGNTALSGNNTVALLPPFAGG